MFDSDDQIDFENGHFYESGLMKLNAINQEPILRILPKLEEGYEKVTSIIKNGGITTIADLAVKNLRKL